VLVETFEEGELISQYVGKQGRYNRQLADLGLHCYLKMLIKDNFIHADLVRLAPASGTPCRRPHHCDRPPNGHTG
jgi:hypothetical protein